VQPLSRSNNQLIFLSPSISSDDGGRLPAPYNVSFIMDGVSSVRDNLAVFTLMPNPTLLPFTGGRKDYRGEILSLQVNLSVT